ncbi:MAG: hypothetical protein LBU89_07405, partial [Fibromonadaceae bacterium]|nr:hypothetical protein [Fibromonadaceae bacterium]
MLKITTIYQNSHKSPYTNALPSVCYTYLPEYQKKPIYKRFTKCLLYLYPIPHTQQYYNLHGQPLGTQKPTVPGVYIEKRLGVAKRI